ncbi:DNA alkylation repair protein [Leptospira yasudae]|uniref:DNA alkylation repair protein n=1 Tax=Leptospira yasudae TaxID=2202201 RepID=A0ABX9M7G3_9LEPT|nr:DNA alkylation repair protein [Leptospira yasudae]RHX80923.1 DNA alkylation repair protein [Leptospira yasudae]
MQKKKQKPKSDSVRPTARKEKTAEPTANQFVKELTALKTKADLEKNSRFLHNGSKANLCLGVRMGKIFETAKKYKNMPLEEIAVLIKNPYYEIRMGAVSILDFLARDKKSDEKFKKRLFDLYIKNHKHINNWDLVDRSAGHVIGRFLFDKSREPLYKLARSKNPMERRTAIVSTSYFIMNKDPNETFRIAEILKDDRDETVQKAVGSWVREAGKKDKPRLLDFLNRHSATLPRITLRAAIERLDAKEKEFYLRSNKN